MATKRLIIVVLLLSQLFSVVSQVSLAQGVIPIHCGDIIQSETNINNKLIIYEIQATAGTIINARIEPIGTTLRVANQFFDSGENMFYSSNDGLGGQSEIIQSLQLSVSNPIWVIGGSNERIATYYFWDSYITYGAFTVYLGCELSDGTVIEPNDPLDNTRTDVTNGVSSAQMELFSGFGFPGVNSVDFSKGIELPLILGQPQTAPLANDIALYTYMAAAGEVTTLRLSRVSGDISIGVTVINKNNNEIVFLGGMPSSNNLSVELTFPTDGTYAIGLFRLDTDEHSESSGAVQILIE